MKKHTKRLALTSETIARIDAAQLDTVHGGGASGGSCAGFGCAVTGKCTQLATCGGQQLVELKEVKR